MAARKKSKAKKPAETMRQKQMRLRREALARKAANRKALPPGKKGGPLAKTTKALPAGKTARAALPPGKKGGGLSRAVRGVKGVGPNAAVGRLAGRIAVPLGMVSTVAGMRDRFKRDAERNKRLGRKPFQELRDAASSKGNTKRRGQGSRARTGPTISKTKRPMANLPKDYKKTEAAAFKGAQKPKPKAQTSKSRPAAVATPKKAAAPKAAPKKVTKKVSGVGPVASGRTYSVKKTGMSVMQQQAAELRKMREASKKRQAADKAKLKKSQSKKKKR